ncbi:MAG: hypothetical protein F6K65_36220 [Moorea sp. SIO3C2]|nr:hypothetical protein [Moorena sp. SIO3C2]
MNAPSFEEAENIDYLLTNVEASLATPNWVVENYSQRNWIEVFYREAKCYLGATHGEFNSPMESAP